MSLWQWPLEDECAVTCTAQIFVMFSLSLDGRTHKQLVKKLAWWPAFEQGCCWTRKTFSIFAVHTHTNKYKKLSLVKENFRLDGVYSHNGAPIIDRSVKCSITGPTEVDESSFAGSPQLGKKVHVVGVPIPFSAFSYFTRPSKPSHHARLLSCDVGYSELGFAEDIIFLAFVMLICKITVPN